jgi:hypothetical protein
MEFKSGPVLMGGGVSSLLDVLGTFATPAATMEVLIISS